MSATMEGNTEIMKYEETIKHLFKLLKRVCQERDEAREQLQFLLRNLQPCNSAETNGSISQFGQYPKPPTVLNYKTKLSMKNTRASDISSKAFFDLSLASPSSNEKHFEYQGSHTINEKHSYKESSHTRKVESNNLALPKQPNYQSKLGASRDNINMVGSSSLAIDKVACEKPLPQKGRLLQTVTEAKPLLQTLLLTPLQQWQTPPSLSSSCILPSGTYDHDYYSKADDVESVNPSGGIPTSLSLAFPNENSYEHSHMSSMKNELILFDDMDPIRMHNQGFKLGANFPNSNSLFLSPILP
ncbi:hypothetical protein RIF29_40069 [Crotalaria pallida]|uniref:Uncharacterized protein n=1 Tax=Crotalaria pallida TaxID=3830 RepID=A0AAN9HQA4_CROPI